MKDKSSSKRVINAGIAENFLSDVLCFKWAKESENRLCEKLKALSTGWKILKQPFNVLIFWVCASFPYTENRTMVAINKLGKVWFCSTFLLKFYGCFLRNFKSLKQLYWILSLQNQKVADEKW